jgi:hypothetical protein
MVDQEEGCIWHRFVLGLVIVLLNISGSSTRTLLLLVIVVVVEVVAAVAFVVNNICYIIIIIVVVRAKFVLVTMAWYVLRLQTGEASRYDR